MINNIDMVSDNALMDIELFHGIWIKENTKGDDGSGMRLQQSKIVRDSIRHMAKVQQVDKIILGGDFNLDIDTKALHALEGDSLINLIRTHGITDTRTSYYRNYSAGGSLYADYALVSPQVEVLDFTVLNHVMASDHAPLLLTFN